MTQLTGKHLKELRLAAEMTIDELVEAVGMKDRRTMIRWHHSEEVLRGKSLAAVEHFLARGGDRAAAMEAIALWRDAPAQSSQQ